MDGAVRKTSLWRCAGSYRQNSTQSRYGRPCPSGRSSIPSPVPLRLHDSRNSPLVSSSQGFLPIELPLRCFTGVSWLPVLHLGFASASPLLCHIARLTRAIAIAIATVTIQIRCIYRVVELAGGFRSEAANDQPAFMVLDGPMIMIAVGALTICHPGPLFFTEWTRLGVDSGYPGREHTTLEEKVSPKSVNV